MNIIIGIIIFVGCAFYGITQMIKGKPAFKWDYWVMCFGILVSLLFLLN